MQKFDVVTIFSCNLDVAVLQPWNLNEVICPPKNVLELFKVSYYQNSDICEEIFSANEII